MGELVELDHFRRIWSAGWVRCVDCGHAWVGVYVAGSTGLECPKCGGMHGRPFEPHG